MTASRKPASAPPADARSRSVLLIDDEPTVLQAVAQLFKRFGWTVSQSTDSRAAIELYERERPDLVMCDLEMPDLNGLKVLEILRERDPDATVIMLSGKGDIETVVRCMQLGAEHFLTKPLEPRHLSAVVDGAYEKSTLRRRNRVLAELQLGDSNLASLGSSPAMLEVARQITLLADGNAPIVLMGETGSGKGWIAKLIHAASSRRHAPFVSINCAGLSATFLDAELFGHEKGAFTDAKTMKMGMFELANGGTLMLDEIGDLALELQPKLLTALETQRFRRLGGTREIQVDVRLIAATHVDLADAVKAGKFRQDLFYRIAALPIHIPSLRARGRDEVAALALKLVAELHRQLGRGPARVSTDALDLIVRFAWPGNVRELRNVLERALLLAANEPELLPRHLPAELRGSAGPGTDAGALGDDLSIDGAVKRHILRVLESADGNRAKAAKLLGMSRQTLYNRLAEYGLDAE
ncbi:MAG TPA: sigma-54 dependent transcriptional regulator [Gemmatimonadaceae bacterium]|nr:sigma-54 dependent transcriptional regulator [Gemmatimonadaceae bacterium]